jgi:hypothetical protein
MAPQKQCLYSSRQSQSTLIPSHDLWPSNTRSIQARRDFAQQRHSATERCRYPMILEIALHEMRFYNELELFVIQLQVLRFDPFTWEIFRKWRGHVTREKVTVRIQLINKFWPFNSYTATGSDVSMFTYTEISRVYLSR